jgi:hypothetical protein
MRAAGSAAIGGTTTTSTTRGANDEASPYTHVGDHRAAHDGSSDLAADHLAKAMSAPAARHLRASTTATAGMTPPGKQEERPHHRQANRTRGPARSPRNSREVAGQAKKRSRSRPGPQCRISPSTRPAGMRPHLHRRLLQSHTSDPNANLREKVWEEVCQSQLRCPKLHVALGRHRHRRQAAACQRAGLPALRVNRNGCPPRSGNVAGGNWSNGHSPRASGTRTMKVGGAGPQKRGRLRCLMQPQQARAKARVKVQGQGPGQRQRQRQGQRQEVDEEPGLPRLESLGKCSPARSREKR